MKSQRSLLIPSPILVSLFFIVGYFQFENYTGAKRWEAVKSRLETEGVLLTLADFEVTKLPPAETNFAATPLIWSCLDFEVVDEEIVYANPAMHQRFLSMKLPKFTHRNNPSGSWSKGKMPDFDKFLKAIIAEGVLSVPSQGSAADRILGAYSIYESEFAELVEAADRPHAQLPVVFPDTFIEAVSQEAPWRDIIRSQVRLQKLLASCYLETGQRGRAMDSVRVLGQFANLCSSYPSQIEIYMNLAISGLIHSLVWEGTELNVWTSADYEIIGNILDSQHIFEHAERSMNMELALYGILGCDHMKAGNFFSKRGREFRAMSSSYIQYADFYPNGIWDHNKATFCEIMFDQTMSSFRNGDFSHAKMPPINETPKNMWLYPLGVFFNSEFFVARHESYRRLVFVSCGIERYRIENKTLPQRLDDLIPTFLDSIPRDVMDPANSLQYIVDPLKSTYTLYSIGLDKIDNDGQVSWRRSGNRDHEKGDWAWGIPALTPPQKVKTPEK